MRYFISPLVLIVLLAQLNCTSDDVEVNTFKDDVSIASLNGEWKVISFEDYGSGKVEFKTQENSWDKDILLTFNDNMLSGTNITNHVQGEYKYVGRRQFNVTSFATTYVNQPEWADKFMEAMLDDDLTFKINKTGLRIYYDKSSRSVTLTKR